MNLQNYESTIATIAGHILSGVMDEHSIQRIGLSGVGNDLAVKGAVAVARAIVDEVQRTKPEAQS